MRSISSAYRLTETLTSNKLLHNCSLHILNKFKLYNCTFNHKSIIWWRLNGRFKYHFKHPINCLNQEGMELNDFSWLCDYAAHDNLTGGNLNAIKSGMYCILSYKPITISLIKYVVITRNMNLIWNQIQRIIVIGESKQTQQDALLEGCN
jgi:hypothetical protein